MSLLFADSFYFVALLNPQDQAHARALEYSQAGNAPLIITAWVLTELADGLCRQLRASSSWGAASCCVWPCEAEVR